MSHYEIFALIGVFLAVIALFYAFYVLDKEAKKYLT